MAKKRKDFKQTVEKASLTITGAAIIPDQPGRLTGTLFLELAETDGLVAPFKIDGPAAESLMNALERFFKGEGRSMSEIDDDTRN